MNVVKINFYGTVFSKENKSRVSAVVRDDNGLVLASCAKIVSQAYSAVEIESMAATIALSFTSDLGIRLVVLEGDSLEMIKALKENAHS